jgi:hypothetical protein
MEMNSVFEHFDDVTALALVIYLDLSAVDIRFKAGNLGVLLFGNAQVVEDGIGFFVVELAGHDEWNAGGVRHQHGRGDTALEFFGTPSFPATPSLLS